MPTITERFRFAGALTPFVIAFVLLLPWVSGAFVTDGVRINGYRVFDELCDQFAHRGILVGMFAISTLAIGWLSFRGGLEGGSDMPGATFAAAIFSIGSLFVLTQALPESSRSIIHFGGASSAFGTLLLGTAFGVLPGQGNSPSANVIFWIICGGCAVAGFILLLVGSGMGTAH